MINKKKDSDYKNIEYFYDNDSFKNIEKIESIVCYHCNKIYFKKDLDNLYLINRIVKTKVINYEIFNCVWYPLCNNCQNSYDNVIIKN